MELVITKDNNGNTPLYTLCSGDYFIDIVDVVLEIIEAMIAVGQSILVLEKNQRGQNALLLHTSKGYDTYFSPKIILALTKAGGFDLIILKKMRIQIAFHCTHSCQLLTKGLWQLI